MFPRRLCKQEFSPSCGLGWLCPAHDPGRLGKRRGGHAFLWPRNGGAFSSRKLDCSEGNMLSYVIHIVHSGRHVSPLGQAELFLALGREMNFWSGTSCTGTR